MGRKKGGKNPEGHKAGGARMGAGRPRKAGPLTLKAAIRAHAHQPTDHTIFIRRDEIHPALQPFLDIPAHYTLRCCNCGHSDPTKLLEMSPPLSAEDNPATTPNLFSRSQSPGSAGEPLSAVSVDFGHRDDTSSLFTPPQSVSPGGSSISDPDNLHSALSTDESVVSHAESLLMLNTASPSITISTVHQTYELEPQELTPAASHAHAHLSVMQPNHIAQSPITYNQTYIPDYLSQNNVNHPDQFTNPGPEPQSPYRMFNSQPEPHFTPTSTTPPSFPGTSEPPLPSPQQSYYPQQTRPPEFSQQQAQHFYAPAPSYSEQQPADMYFPQAQAQALQQPQHIKSGPAAWRHAPHSTSIPPAVAAILPPQHTHPQQQLDSTGPVQFLPTGQHTQRRRRRCVICIGAGRGDEADRCCGRGNRHLCPLYSKHGSPENIMEIRNAKHVRPTTAT